MYLSNLIRNFKFKCEFYSLLLFFQGTRVWLKDPEKVWKAARVTENYNGGGSKLQLELEDDATPLALEIGI